MKFQSKAKAFACHYLELHRVTVQVKEPLPYAELRRSKNGVEFYINHLYRTILVRFPGGDWIDFEQVKRFGELNVIQSELVTSLDECQLSQLNKVLRVRREAK